MKIQFHGHSTFSVSDGEHRVLIDPFLTDNPKADVGVEAFEKLDAVLLTHGHFDHTADVEAVVERSGALVVSNFEIVTHFGKKGLEGHPMHIGGGRSFPFGHVKWTIAHHGSTGADGEALGNPMGVVLTMGDKKLYHAGDTALFMDMQLIGELYGPLDVAILPIGDNFTMGIDDAVKAAEFLEASLYVPMHFDTWPPIEVDAAEFIRKLEADGRRGRLMQPGDVLEV